MFRATRITAECGNVHDQLCLTPSRLPAALPTTDDFATYIEAVKADTSIPPACAADLIAVAETLQTEQPTSP